MSEPQVVETFDDYAINDKYNGYLNMVKMKDVIKEVTADSIVTETTQAHGFKRIIFTTSGTHDITRFKNIYTEGDGIDLRTMTLSEFDTLMQSGVDKGGVYNFVGNFDPVEGEDIVVNIHGQHIIRSNPSRYAIEQYDTDFASLVSEISVDKATGNIVASGSVGTQVIFKVGDATQIIIEDGIITLVSAQVNLNLTDLFVSGTLTVDGISTLNAKLNVTSGGSDISGAVDITGTLDSSGKAQLEGTNIVSS